MSTRLWIDNLSLLVDVCRCMASGSVQAAYETLLSFACLPFHSPQDESVNILRSNLSALFSASHMSAFVPLPLSQTISMYVLGVLDKVIRMRVLGWLQATAIEPARVALPGGAGYQLRLLERAESGLLTVFKLLPTVSLEGVKVLHFAAALLQCRSSLVEPPTGIVIEVGRPDIGGEFVAAYSSMLVASCQPLLTAVMTDEALPVSPTLFLALQQVIFF